MKKAIILSIIFAFVFGLALGEATAQKTKKQKKQSAQVAKQKKGNCQSCPNAAGKAHQDSTCASNQGKHKCQGMQARRGARDCFIDKDKDGINDNRCNGMGLGKRNCKNKCKRIK